MTAVRVAFREAVNCQFKHMYKPSAIQIYSAHVEDALNISHHTIAYRV